MFSSKPWKIESSAAEGPAGIGEHPLTRLRDELQSLFDSLFRRWPAPYQPGRHLEHFWNLDVQESETEVVIRAEAPGFEATEFHVEVTDKLLSIRTDRAEEGGDKRTPFQRSISLPPGLDLDRVEARYQRGVLEVHLPKTAEGRGKRVPVSG